MENCKDQILAPLSQGVWLLTLVELGFGLIETPIYLNLHAMGVCLHKTEGMGPHDVPTFCINEMYFT